MRPTNAGRSLHGSTIPADPREQHCKPVNAAIPAATENITASTNIANPAESELIHGSFPQPRPPTDRLQKNEAGDGQELNPEIEIFKLPDRSPASEVLHAIVMIARDRAMLSITLKYGVAMTQILRMKFSNPSANTAA
jgi:hypothetical protein